MNWLNKLQNRVEALGDNASEEQKEALVNWIIQNVPQAYWMSAAEECINIPGMYTEFSMRSSENQCC